MPSLAELLLRTVDAIFAVDARQRIALWDRGCEELFGIRASNAIGHPCSEVVRGKNALQQPFCGGCCCLASFAENASVPSAFPLRARGAQGQELHLSVSLLLVPSQQRNRRLCVHLVRRGQMVAPELSLQADDCAKRSRRVRGSERAPHQAGTLTAREQEILKLLAEGLPLGSISELMRISLVTVRNHVQHIEAKFAVHSQAETVAYAYRHNLV